MGFNRKSQGFSILELTLALVVAALLILAGSSQYRRAQVHNNVVALQSSVDLLLNSLSNYYYGNCRTLSRSAPTTIDIEKDLVPNYLPNTELITNPLNPAAGLNSFSLYLEFVPSRKNWLMTVQVFMPVTMPEKMLNSYGGMLDPSSVAGSGAKSMIWQRIPESKKSLGIGLQPQSEDLDRFARDQQVDDKYKPASYQGGGTTPCSVLDQQYLQNNP